MKRTWLLVGAMMALGAAAAAGCFSERAAPPLSYKPEPPTEPEWPVCVPGEQRACYTGRSGTADVGICRKGLEYCRPLGDRYGDCEGEIIPKEIDECEYGLDGDCDGKKDDCLVDRGLVTRHFIDQGSSGMGGGGGSAEYLRDSQHEPVDLTIENHGGMDFYVDRQEHEGLRWDSWSDSSRAYAEVGATKLAGKLGNTGMTLELVLQVDDCYHVYDPFDVDYSTVVSIGRLSILCNTLDGIGLVDCSGCGMAANAGFDYFSERSVLHVVIVSSLVAQPELARIYQNGSLLTYGQLSSQRIELMPSDLYSLGRSGTSSYSFGGVIYYSAIYDVAFTEEEVSNNAAILLERDDAP